MLGERGLILTKPVVTRLPGFGQSNVDRDQSKFDIPKRRIKAMLKIMTCRLSLLKKAMIKKTRRSNGKIKKMREQGDVKKAEYMKRMDRTIKRRDTSISASYLVGGRSLSSTPDEPFETIQSTI